VEIMMLPPTCPDHGRTVFDFALGRLDDVDAQEAEELRLSCSQCRRWWRENLEGTAAESVDRAVMSVFRDLELPRRRRVRSWLAAAAALVMVVGAGLLWLIQEQPGASPAPIQRSASIQILDFENADLTSELVHVRVIPPTLNEERGRAASGREGPTAEHTEAVLAEGITIEKAIDAEPLFAGGFESGDLGGWVPST
jgi:hypothetical protein